MRRASVTRSFLIAVAALAATAAPAAAADFVPIAGTYTVNTTTLKLTGPGGTDITGADESGIATFRFGTVNIANTVTINASGNKPFRVVASGNLTMAGLIISNGTNATAGNAVANAGGAGGGAGGGVFPAGGSGPGGGRAASTSVNGASGGGYGGAGARGGGSPFAAAGPAYGNLNAAPGALRGGSGGGAGSTTGGGGGGGAIALFGQFVTVTGTILADGGAGDLGGNGASAGGSGGGIVIHGDTVDVTGALAARGGDGGRGGCCGNGGGGGGGRIAYQFRTLVSSGTALVNGGTSGVRDTTGCCPGGITGPDATGAAGLVTKLQAATSTTTPATGVSFSAATLNGTINPRGNPTTYFFDFGPTTDYGTQVPAGGGDAGSGSGDRVLSEAVGGLAPSTTYHYRLVAVDSLGFTTIGPDIGFTTPEAPVPPPSGGGGGGGVVPQVDPTQILIAMPFAFSKSTNRWTRFTLLQVKAIPIGSLLKVSCKAPKKKKCPGGSSYTKTNAFGTVSLKKWLKKKLPAGTKMTVTVTKPGNFIGAVKIMTIRKKNRPRFTDRCLPPGATRAVGC